MPFPTPWPTILCPPRSTVMLSAPTMRPGPEHGPMSAVRVTLVVTTDPHDGAVEAAAVVAGAGAAEVGVAGADAPAAARSMRPRGRRLGSGFAAVDAGVD